MLKVPANRRNARHKAKAKIGQSFIGQKARSGNPYSTSRKGQLTFLFPSVNRRVAGSKPASGTKSAGTYRSRALKLPGATAAIMLVASPQTPSSKPRFNSNLRSSYRIGRFEPALIHWSMFVRSGASRNAQCGTRLQALHPPRYVSCALIARENGSSEYIWRSKCLPSIQRIQKPTSRIRLAATSFASWLSAQYKRLGRRSVRLLRLKTSNKTSLGIVLNAETMWAFRTFLACDAFQPVRMVQGRRGARPPSTRRPGSSRCPVGVMGSFGVWEPWT